MLKKNVKIFVFFILLALIFPSCAVEGDFYGGVELDDGKMSEIKMSILGTEEGETVSSSYDDQKEIAESAKATGEEESLTVEESAETVYWTKNGEVWHNDKNCRYIKNSNVISGSLDSAKEEGKERACSACGG